MKFSKLYLGSDHGGLEKKQQIIKYLDEQNINYEDLGPFEYEASDDYVDFAIKVSKKVQSDPEAKGIILCKSGIGMYQVANKFKGIRAAEVRSVEEAKTDVHHHGSNVLVLAGILEQADSPEEILQAWLDTEFEEDGRHERRIKKMKLVERENIDEYPDYPRIVPAVLFDEVEGYKTYSGTASSFSPRLHIDIMDGEYVESTSPSTLEVAEALKDTDSFLAFHLMVKKPSHELLSKLSEYKNVNLVYIHIEEIDPDILDQEYSFDIYGAIRPEVDIEEYKDIITRLKGLLILPIIPGFYGAKFMPEELSKIDKIREMGFDGEIYLDGSINLDTIEEVMKKDPDLLNVGSAIAKREDPGKAYNELIEKVKSFM